MLVCWSTSQSFRNNIYVGIPLQIPHDFWKKEGGGVSVKKFFLKEILNKKFSQFPNREKKGYLW